MPLRPALLTLVATIALNACSEGTATTLPIDPAAQVSAEMIAPDYAVRGQIAVADLSAISAAGFRTVINNRPDGEEPDQPTSAELAAEAARLGLFYHHVPVAKSGPTSDDATALAGVLKGNKGPVLAFCRSGKRAQALKAMADTI